MSRSMRQDLDTAMVGVVLDERRRTAILEAAEKGEKPVKKVIRPMVVLAAVIAALTISALAFSPSLREVLTGVLGDFAPYIQEIKGISATDQGLQIKVLSAISDGNVATIYFEVQDLKGDRLDENLWVDTREIDRPEAQYAAASYSSPACLGYDADARTALLRFRFIGDGRPASGGTLHLEFDSVLPDADRFPESPFPDIVPSRKELQSKTIFSGETVLMPSQTPVKLGNTNQLELSSYGFAADGKLHILYQINAQNVNRDETWVNVFIDSKEEQSDPNSDYERINRYNVSGPGTLDVFFEQDGILYLDSRTGVTPEDINDISLRNVYGSIVTKEKIVGQWVLDVPLQDVEYRTIPMSEAIGKIIMKSIDFTTLGASLESDPNGSGGMLGYPLTVFLSDGSKVLAGSSDSGFHSGGYVSNHWSFPEPIDTSQVIGVAIGMWYTPLEGDTAGPGYWLDELPE